MLIVISAIPEGPIFPSVDAIFFFGAVSAAITAIFVLIVMVLKKLLIQPLDWRIKYHITPIEGKVVVLERRVARTMESVEETQEAQEHLKEMLKEIHIDLRVIRELAEGDRLSRRRDKERSARLGGLGNISEIIRRHIL